MLEIRRGTPEDYQQVTDQVVASFRTHTPAHPRFEDFDPVTVNPTPQAMSAWRLAYVDGKLAGGLVMVPRRLRLGKTEVTYGGIGHVHCMPGFRKQGVFSALLRRVIQDMRQEGIPLSALGGDRLRYGHYGWEHAGVYRTLRLEPAMLRFRAPETEPTILDFREYRGEEEDTLRIWKARESAFACPLRGSLEECRNVLLRPGRPVYLWNPGGDRFAYAVLKDRTIQEYGGDVEGVEKIVRYVLGTGSWNVLAPPPECSGALEEMLDGYAQNFLVENLSQFRVNLLGKTLELFRPWLEERLQSWQGSMTLKVEDGEDSETVTLARASGQGLVIRESREAPALTLSRRELPPLLFGPALPASLARASEPFWRLAFPLPLFWPSLEHV
ncbi:MAG: GNAT family N-acetyltransferase [Oligosphaeraceae bacterium]